MSALAGLPEAAFAIAPELRFLTDISEPRAPCGACPVAVPAAQLPANPHLFHEDARCCTYHPELPAWLAGRALRDPVSAPLIRARLQNPEGRRADGIAPPASTQVTRGQFGRRIEDRCPYWAGGELACGIWAHRTEVCRTWHCRYSDGDRSRMLWGDAKRLMRLIFDRLNDYCMQSGEPPGEDAGAEEHEAWYLACDALIEQAPLDLVAALRDGEIADAAERLTESIAALDLPLPPLLVVAISDVQRRSDGSARLCGHSPRDGVDVPPGIFLFLGRLDGQKLWRQALEEARADGLKIEESLVELLYRRTILRPPRSKTMEPGGQLTLNGVIIG
ncbi:MAG: hypothetical protein ACI8S6_002479 [Myxococcota bacterium]|jgi:hypothetical protein